MSRTFCENGHPVSSHPISFGNEPDIDIVHVSPPPSQSCSSWHIEVKGTAFPSNY